MNYLFELIKKKKYRTVFISMFFILVGLASFIPYIYEVINGLSAPHKEISNAIIILFCGILLLFFGISYIPKNSGENLDKEDIDIKYLENNDIEVKYKQYRFILKNGTNTSYSFPEIDEDKNEVPKLLTRQLPNAIKIYFPKFKENIVSENSITINKKSSKDELELSNLNKMCDDEKEKYIKKRKFLGEFTFFLSLMMVMISVFCFFYLEYNSDYMSKIEVTFVALIVLPICGLTGSILLVKSWKDLMYKISLRNGEVYITDCYIYDKTSKRRTKYSSNYFLKVKTEADYYITDWIKTSKKLFDENSIDKKYKLVIINYDYKTKFDVQPIEMFESNSIN